MGNWFEGQAYVDDKGNMYKVMPAGHLDNMFRAKYCKPDTAGWYTMWSLKLRLTVEDAQSDLDALAKKNGWEPA